MKKHKLGVLLTGAVMAVAVAACGSDAEEALGGAPDVDASGDGDVVSMQLGHVFGSDSTQHQAAERMAADVAEATDGAVEISVFPDGQLGGDESMAQDLSRGTLALAWLNPGSLAGVDDMFDFHYLPYIAMDYDQVDELFYGDGIIPETIESTLEDNGMRSLGLFDLEFRAVSNNDHSVESLADLDGLTLRVPGSEAIRGFFDTAGVQTQVMPMPELLTGLEQGTIDGQDNGILITRDAGLSDIQDYMTATRHVFANGAVTISEQIWDGLDDETQTAIQTAAADAVEWQIEQNRSRIDDYIDERLNDGHEYIELSDEAMSEFVEFGQSLWDEYADRYGQDNIDQLRSEVAALN